MIWIHWQNRWLKMRPGASLDKCGHLFYVGVDVHNRILSGGQNKPKKADRNHIEPEVCRNILKQE